MKLNLECWRFHFMAQFNRPPTGLNDKAMPLKAYLREVTTKAIQQAADLSAIYMVSITKAEEDGDIEAVARLRRESAVHIKEPLSFFEYNCKVGVSLDSLLKDASRIAEEDYQTELRSNDAYMHNAEVVSSSPLHSSSLPPSSPPASKALKPKPYDERLILAYNDVISERKNVHQASRGYKVSYTSLRNKVKVSNACPNPEQFWCVSWCIFINLMYQHWHAKALFVI